MAMTTTPVHLILLIHGLYGHPSNLKYVVEQLRKTIPRIKDGLPVELHVTESFTGSKSWDGIDYCAERTAVELDRVVERLKGEEKEVAAFSIMGYSLGGLIARYLVGILHSRTPSFFDLHRPVSFSTTATPHLGVLRYGTWINHYFHKMGHYLFSRSGQHVYLLDDDHDGRPLLDIMADPNMVWLKALQLFPKILIIANGTNDRTVPYPSGAISLQDPFDKHAKTGVRVVVDENHIVQSWSLPSEDEVPDSTGQIGSAVSDATDLTKQKAPRVPPMFLLPPPFTYLLVVLAPVAVPIWLLGCFVVACLHTYQSNQRIRLSGDVSERRNLLLGKVTEKTALLASGESDIPPYSTPSTSTSGASTPTVVGTPSYNSLSKRSSPLSIPSRSFSRNRPNFESSESFLPPPPIPKYTKHSPPDYLTIKPFRPSSSSSDNDDDRDREAQLPIVIATPGLESRSIQTFQTAQIPLLMTDLQRNMVKNLNESLPQIERLVGWFPWVDNAHGIIISRDRNRWERQEEGMGVVRGWVGWVLGCEVEIGVEGE